MAASRTLDLPSKDEQLQLRETRNLMSTGILQLQMDEMLSETRKSGKKSSNLKNWLENLIQRIKGIETSSNPITPHWMREQGMNEISFRDDNSSIQFQQPTRVETIGSSSLQVATNPFLNIDLAIQLPVDIFNERDVLNYSYFDKRNLYLGYLHWFLSQQSDIIQAIEFGFLKYDMRKPISLITPNIKTNYQIRLFLAAPEESFKLSQLRPLKNNVRPAWWIEALLKIRNDENRSTNEMDSKSLPPTPNYNMAILEDVILFKSHDYLSKYLDNHPSLRDVIIVVKIWLTQRELRWGIDSVDGHLILFLIVYLSLSGVILPHMTALTGFMTFLKYVSELEDNQLQQTLRLGKPEPCCGLFALELYLPIFSTRKNGQSEIYNFLWRVSSTSLDQLKDQAKYSLRLLQIPSSLETTIATSSFQSVFLQKSSFVQNYDLIFHISCPDIDGNKLHELENNSSPDLREIYKGIATALDDLTPWQYTSKRAQALIQESLGNRATKVHIYSQPHYSTTGTNTSSIWPSGTGVNVVVGILLNSANMHRRVDRGPSASDEIACLKFKEFWGNKSELRRFQDGSIIEAVVWTENNSSQTIKKSRSKDLITTIISYILQRHLPFSLEISTASTQFDELLPEVTQNLPQIQSSSSKLISYSTQTLYRRTIEVFDYLRRLLTSDLKGFPLVIESLRPTSPALRYTSFFPSLFNPLLSPTKDVIAAFSGERVNPVNQVIPIVAQLQKSSRWPNDLTAVQSLKSALVVKLSTSLEHQFSIHSVIHVSSLDIFFEGYIFRLSFFTDQELPLLAPELPGFDNLRLPSIRERYPKELSTHFRRMIVDPQHHLAIHTLCSRYESFSDTVRLLTYWVDMQSLSGYLDHEILELIVASVYLPGQSSTTAPHCAGFGLLKALSRIAEFDWENHPLLVDLSFNEDTRIASTNLDQVYSEFSSLRKLSHGGPCFSIAAKYEQSGFFNFDYGLSLCDYSLKNMIVTAAKHSSQQIVNSLNHGLTTIPMTTLHNQIPNFDVTIFFIRSAVSNHGKLSKNYDTLLLGPQQTQIEILQNLPFSELPNQIVASEESLPHPFQRQYVTKLRRQFDHLALFFYNHLEGNQVGIIWKPTAFFPRNFSALHGRSRSYATDLPLAVINTSELVSEMISMGNGIVDHVVIR